MKHFFTLILALISWAAFSQTVWHPVASGTNQKLNCISFGTAQVGFIGGNDSLLLKTTDGGKTWNRLAINLNFTNNFKDIVAVNFVDAVHGYIIVGPYGGGVFSTSDGGATWTDEAVNQTNMCYKRSLYFVDANNGFTGGSMCFFGETIGRKQSGIWDTLFNIGDFNASNQITNFDFLDAQNGLASGTGKYIFKTTDGGNSWDSIPTGFDTIGTSDVLFLTDSLAYAVYPTVGLEGVLISTDGGLTWVRDGSLATFAYPGFSSAVKTKFNQPFFGGWPSWGNGGIIFSKSPLWWNYSLVDQRINDLATHSDSVVFAVGDSGYIVVNTLPASIGIAEEVSKSISIFPNPFINTVHFGGVKTETQLQIFTANGQLLRQEILVQPETNLDVSDLKSGVYFFVLVNEEETVTVKMVK